jgi:TolB-like protein
MKILLVIILFVFPLHSQGNVDSQINNLCLKISQEMSENNKTTVAVLEFSDLDGKFSKLGKYLSEEIITHLFQTKKFQVIERQLLNKVIKEQKLQESGIFDDSSVKKLGKLLGVNTIISGTMTDLGNSVKINARLISTETAEIYATASCEIEKTESILKLLNSNPSGEGAVNESKDSNCKEKNIGDYCFLNNTKFNLTIVFYTKRGQAYQGTIQPDQQQCFYDLDAGSMSYEINSKKPAYYSWPPTADELGYHTKGSLYIEACAEKTFIIK